MMPFDAPDRSGHFKDDHVQLIQCVTFNTETSKQEPAPFYDSDARIHGASWARIDNRKELAAKLGLDSAAMAQMCDTELIYRCYQNWGEDCVDHLVGDFVFVLYDEKNRKAFCGRDHMGVKPFYYFLSDDEFICATSLPPLIHMDDLRLQIRKKWIVDYLSRLSESFDRTPYEEILKLPPAHTLSVTPEKHILRQYFTLTAEPELKLNDSREYVDAYREQLETAIQCRLNTTFPLGAELSGGLDSSTITAYAARFFDQSLANLHTFAFANAELEPQYILAVSQAFDILNNHVLTDLGWRDNQSVRDRALMVLGYPVEHRNATHHDHFYQLAETTNVRTLLSGFGGDEFSTTLHGYMVPLEMLLKRRFKDVYDILPGNALYRFLRLIKLELRRLKTRNFTRPKYNPRFLNAWNQRWPHQIVSDTAVQTYDLKRRYFEPARFDAGYSDLKQFTLEKRCMPFIPTRLENCTLMAASRKVEYRWPLLDIRLVKLWLSIPSKENYFRGMGRYLHRRAVDGLVPQMINWKQSKSMGGITSHGLGKSVTMPSGFLESLHPVLRNELVDTEKLSRQVNASELEGHSDIDLLSFQRRRNLMAVMEVNHWLKHSVPFKFSD